MNLLYLTAAAAVLALLIFAPMLATVFGATFLFLAFFAGAALLDEGEDWGRGE